MTTINSNGGLVPCSELCLCIQSWGKQALQRMAFCSGWQSLMIVESDLWFRDTHSPDYPRDESSPWCIGVSHLNPLIKMIQLSGMAIPSLHHRAVHWQTLRRQNKEKL